MPIKKLITVLFFCLAVCASVSSYADSCENAQSVIGDAQIKTLLEPLGKEEFVRNHFQQTRVMALLKQPLVAKGEMLFAVQHGLYWKTQEPFDYTLVVTPEKIVQIASEQRSVIEASKQPSIFATGNIFSGLLTGDIEGLREYFDVYETGSGESSKWSLCLLPRQGFFQSWIKYITVSGASRVVAVHLRDHNDDYTEILFSPRGDSGPLSADEQAYFQ